MNQPAVPNAWSDRPASGLDTPAAPAPAPQHGPLTASVRGLAIVPEAEGRRKGRTAASAASIAALREAVESLRHTVRFLEELMSSRQAEAERATSKTVSDLQDIRRRISWVEDLTSSTRG